MSTRRARIKGVTALPPRRKNADADVKKQQESEVIKTPKTRRVSFDKSINVKNVTPRGSRPSPRKSPRQITRTPEQYTAPERKVFTPTPVEKDRSTPTIEKTAENVFVSPRVRASPRRRSSIVRTPVIEVDVRTERLITSQGVQDVSEKVEISNVVRNTATPISVDKESGNTTDEESQSVHSEVMDGIIPLQPVKVPPKPIDLLKNEIISENAEVSFDPIIPLPSPSKVRPKLRPVPRLCPLRRNSIQGSASESEDESRRALHGAATPIPMRQRERYDSNITLPATNRDLNRVRNDSVCSSISHSISHTPTISSPLRTDKEKNATSSRRLEVSRRMAAMRKRKEAVQRDKLTMYDLIFYNPAANPIIPDQEEIKIKEANKKEEEERKLLEKKKKEVEPKADTAPVPQIKLGPNGEIVLDEESLVIKTSQRDISSGVVNEGSWNNRAGMYRRTPRTAEWTDAETVRFYRAVASIGTDFSLMQPLFPTRTRRDLKLKFKKEEKMNTAQLDKALRAGARWDVTNLEIEFNNERKLAEEKAQKEKGTLRKRLDANKQRNEAMKELKVKRSRGSKALECSILPSLTAKNNLPPTADDFVNHVQNIKKNMQNKRKRKPKTTTESKAAVPKISLPKKKDKPTEPQRSDTPLLHVPTNIENGSLVVLAVDDPKSPSKKMFQTYISHEGGSLTPVNLPSHFLNSVVGYMKKGGSSPQTNSPSTSERATPIDLTPHRKNRRNSSSVTH